MLQSIAPTSPVLTPTPSPRHEFAYPSVTQVAVRAHTVLASSLARIADPVRSGSPAIAR